MLALKRLLPAAALASILILPACGDSTSPGNVDPTVLSGSFDATRTTFTSNPAFQSLSILSDKLPPLAIGAALPLLLASPAQATIAGHRLPFFSSRLRASLASPEALFPANVLGKTMVWDTLTSSYVIGQQAGAPANGMRLLLYFADPQTLLPFKPLQVVGYLELTDKSTPQADKLGVSLMIVQTQVASYDITLVTTTTSARATAAGHFLDGTAQNRVDFSFDQSININTGALVSTNDLTGADGGAIHVVLTANILTNALNIVSRISRDNAALEVGIAGSGSGPFTGAVKYNGATVGTVTGDPDAPLIPGTSGHTFTAAETAAVVAIFAGTLELVTDVANGVFAPGAIVFNAALP